MAGRGRGFRNDQMLKRPGQSTETFSPKPLKNDESNEILKLIDQLQISEYPTDIEVHEMEKILLDAAKSNKLKEVFDELYERAMDDREFGIKFAIVFSDKTIYSLETSDGGKLQIALMRALQNTYMNHEEIKKKSLFQFRNATSLLGEVYNRLRIASLPLRILEEPLLHYMRILLDICEEIDIELVTTQISINGRKIYEENQKQLESFVESVKIVIINRNLSPRSRGMLLFLIDLANQRYNPLSGELQNFYVGQLGISTFKSIQRYTDLLTVNTKIKNQIEDGDQDTVPVKNETKSTDSIGILMKAPSKTDNIVKQDLRRVINNERPVNSGNVPRAIRGSGATDPRNMKKSPRGKKDKLTDEQVWSSKQNSSSKVWGHDDRFEKDYD
ncbi:uncharacterized protein LOC122500071 [Leptopilina heterotoma]|uniref:uncharacterized protein LOC122500071 n=1 Tax=Leptopilina heterotoma TaxID=63436 RepID=UPI001CA9F087|nr:uncharacterized protein LOC122500071 [Leptopilina heterotoma]